MALTAVHQTATQHGPSTREAWVLEGHEHDILSCDSDGTLFTSCGSDGTVQLWRVSTEDRRPSNVATFQSGGPAVVDVAFLRGGGTLAAAQGDGSLSLWELASGKRVCTFRRSPSAARGAWPVENAVTSTDQMGTVFFGGDDGFLVGCDAREKSVVSSLNLHRPITSLASHGDYLFAGDACGHLHWIDLITNRVLEVMDLDTSVISGLAPAPDGHALAVYTMDHEAILLDVQPFARSSAERVLGRLHVAPGGRDSNVLLRCDWRHTAQGGVAVFPSGPQASAVSTDHFHSGKCRSISLGSSVPPNQAMTFAAYVLDDMLLVGGGTHLQLRCC